MNETMRNHRYRIDLFARAHRQRGIPCGAARPWYTRRRATPPAKPSRCERRWPKRRDHGWPIHRCWCRCCAPGWGMVEPGPCADPGGPCRVMPSVPKRCGAQKGQRSVGHRGQLRHDRARTRRGQRRTREVDRVTIDSVRNHCGRHFPVQKRRQSDLPGDPRTPGKGERRRLRRGCGHRAHPHCVLRDGHGQKL